MAVKMGGWGLRWVWGMEKETREISFSKKRRAWHTHQFCKSCKTEPETSLQLQNGPGVGPELSSRLFCDDGNVLYWTVQYQSPQPYGAMEHLTEEPNVSFYLIVVHLNLCKPMWLVALLSEGSGQTKGMLPGRKLKKTHNTTLMKWLTYLFGSFFISSGALLVCHKTDILGLAPCNTGGRKSLMSLT